MNAKPNVCHVISGYFRNDARIFLRQCKSLHTHGFNVSILTNDGGGDQIVDGIRIIDAKKPWPRWRTLLQAKRQMLSAALDIHADIYQLHSPELLPLGLALRRAGKIVVYDAHEDMPRHLLEKEWLPRFTRRALSILFEKYLHYALARYDDVVSPHSHVVANLNNKLQKGILIANFPLVCEDWEFSESEYSQREEVLCYSGTVYAYSNQEGIIRTLENFKNLEYRIAGYIDSGFRERLMASPNSERVHFFGRLSRQALYEFYNSALIGVVVYDYKLNLGDRLGSYGTNKIFEYMEAGLPFICTDYVLWKDIVDRYDCGVCVSPNDPDQLAEAVGYLLRDRKRAYQMGQNGRQAVLREFNWASEEEKYVALFSALASRERAKIA